jgi:N-formylglutamate deformylase
MTYRLHRGTSPLLISIPHCGTALPPALVPRLAPEALALPDTDWFLDRLYAFAQALGVGLIVPLYSRYLIDLNRPRENTPMYPGRNNTELCPTRLFTGVPLYRRGQEPTAEEIAERTTLFWQPYHQALHDELTRLRREHGHAVLFDAHSIKSEVPWLFEGELPHLNLGTAASRSCDGSLRAALAQRLARQERYSQVIDGRFQGGHITRHFGRPREGWHAVQLEMCWRCYMDEAPVRWNPARAAEAGTLLRELVLTMRDWHPGAPALSIV